MSKKHFYEKQEAADAAPVEVKQAEEILMPAKLLMRVGIMMMDFMQVSPYASNSHHAHYKKWKSGQLIFNAAVIEELKNLNAPIKVFVEDVN
jgi:hypothetical protein